MKKLAFLLSLSCTAFAFEKNVDIMHSLTAGTLSADVLLACLASSGRIECSNGVIRKKTNSDPSLCWYIDKKNKTAYMPNPELEGYLVKFEEKDGTLMHVPGVWRVGIQGKYDPAKPHQRPIATFSEIEK